MRLTISATQSLTILNATRRLIGFSIQNLSSSVDIYFSDDQRALDTVDSTNTPTSGHKLIGGAGNQGIIFVPWPFSGTLYARAVSGAPPLEIQPYYGVESHYAEPVNENVPSLSNN